MGVSSRILFGQTTTVINDAVNQSAGATTVEPAVTAAASDAASTTTPKLDILFEDRMSDFDGLVWGIEKDPMLRSTIMTAVVIEGPLNVTNVRRIFERTSRVIPRLRQRVVSNPMSMVPPRWEFDPHFDLDYHVRFARPAEDLSLRGLLDMAAPIGMQGFDRARPLWEALVVPDLANNNSAILLKVHHSITDGVRGVQLLLELFDLEPDAEPRPMPDIPSVHVLNPTERLLHGVRYETQRQLGALRNGLSTGSMMVRQALADPTNAFIAGSELAESVSRFLQPTAIPLSPIMVNRSLSNHFDVISIPLDLTKKIASARRLTVNDIFIGGLARGFAGYHNAHGASTSQLRMGMPINIGGNQANSVAGNAFMPARIYVPINPQDPEDLLKVIHDTVREAKHDPINQLVQPAAGLLKRLPLTITTQLFATIMKGLDFQASNVPGSPIPVYFDGKTVEAVYPFGPTAGAAVNITLLSYQNDLNIGINIDAGAVPDPDVLVDNIADAFDEILSLDD